MRAEIDEIPDVIERQLREHSQHYAELGKAWRESPPVFFVTCARGTSDHAALFFKYLTEIATGIPVASLGPSLGSLYKPELRLKGSQMLAISQSGASPDLVALAQAGRRGGAAVVTLLNVVPSPLSEAADRVLNVAAGPECAVAATKSFLATLTALCAIHAAHTEDTKLLDDLKKLPPLLYSILKDSGPVLDEVVQSRNVVCLGRGLTLSVALEAALKLKETCLVAAEGMSIAEFSHGPMALARPGLTALVFAGNDESKMRADETAARIAASGATIRTFCVGKKAAALHPAVQPVLQIMAFYDLVQKLSLDLGLDPDSPPHLSKATLTV
ncbi:SIS domain-containing protein [Aestuariivirga litoralis]|uniref:SIS domain-containing protein n=1 Tax=Aestuariivirga litoralis TaxID=2650924 RepID=UPI0018C83080|nr:SIS domain-containing protein [Aestuariivirga litoralis]MBG1233920.1 SIS domain-containing protein [Aestuariivirga litoralis]